jgi:proline dehydrogenase
MTPSFANTEIAFQGKSDAALRRAYWLFKAVEYPCLVKTGSALARGALKLHLPVSGLIRQTFFKQFCGGETIDQCASTIESLAKFRIGTILDYSVEGQETEASFDANRNEILRTIELAGKNPSLPFCVFKMTGIARFELMAKLSSGQKPSEAENAEWNRALARLDAICSKAFAVGTRVFVDAEESWIQPIIDFAVHQRMGKFNRQRAVVYNTIQMYRTDRLEFLKRSIQHAQSESYLLGIKLVRGAYMEKEREHAKQVGAPSPIFPDKAATDAAYDESLRISLKNLSRVSICAGTHNEKSSLLLAQWMDEAKIDRADTRIYFAQLLGMGDHISYNLANAGYNVAKYVPYGPVKAVFPYLVRRAEENTAISGQTGRELGLIEQEWERRYGRAVPKRVPS